MNIEKEKVNQMADEIIDKKCLIFKREIEPVHGQYLSRVLRYKESGFVTPVVYSFSGIVNEKTIKKPKV